jgi:hypothetical protein
MSVDHSITSLSNQRLATIGEEMWFEGTSLRQAVMSSYVLVQPTTSAFPSPKATKWLGDSKAGSAIEISEALSLAKWLYIHARE